MSYLAQSRLTEDHYLIGRIAACAAAHGIADPHMWAVNNIWALSAQPGWASAYADATADDPDVEAAAWSPHAGSDPTVITDQMIDGGVTAVLAAEEAANTTTVSEES